MQVPEFWRGADNKLYRIRRVCQRLENERGRRYTVRAFAVGKSAPPVAEASVSMLESDLLEAARLRQKVATPEQLYAEAFQRLMASLGRV